MNDFTFWLGVDGLPETPDPELLMAVAHCLPDGFDLTDPQADE